MTETTPTTPPSDAPDAADAPAEEDPTTPPARVLTVDRVAVRDGRRWLLEPTSFELRTGELVVAVGDPGHGHTLLALALAGRLAGGEGTVSLDGVRDAATLQRSVALVDVPGVTEPDGSVPLATIAGEELAMAGRPARRAAVREWLATNRLGEHLEDRVDDLPPAVRVSALCRLAALRPDVDVVVMVLPERNGDVPDSWVATARELVAADFAVLVTASLGAAALLTAHDDLTVVPLGGARRSTPPETAQPGTTQPDDASEEDA